MEMVNLLIFIISTLVLSPPLLHSAHVSETVCEYDNSSKRQFEETAIFEYGNTKACYFIVNGSNAMANREVKSAAGPYSYFFNITLARDICAKYNATLPSIHSLAEDSFLDIKRFYQFYAIGLKQIRVDGGYKYEWDDGSEFDYQPVWISKYKPATYTVSGGTGFTGAPREWHNCLDQEAFFQSVLVLCKKSYPPKPKSPARNMSICKKPLKQNYAMTSVFRGQWCYFVINGATNMSHSRIFPSAYDYFFYPSIAREICKNESATLPSIEDEEEEKFIMENFQPELFKVESERTSIAEVILLGLNQMKNISDYHWDDGTKFSFHSNWTNKAEYALYTVMHLNKSLWVNRNYMGITGSPIGVLCKQPYFPIVVVTTKATTVNPPSPPPTSAESEPPSRSPQPEPLYLPKESNKCLPENSQHYVKVAQSGDHFCYFVVKGLNERSNHETEDGRFKFQVNQADTVCKEHGGQLPILWDKEDKFILDNFKDEDIDPSGKLGQFSGVALGLKGRSDENGMKVEWSDGTEMASFDQDHWIMEWGKFDYAIMYGTQDGGIEWLPGHPFDTAQSKPVAVVCQQIIPTSSSGNCLIEPTMIISVVTIFLMK